MGGTPRHDRCLSRRRTSGGIYFSDRYNLFIHVYIHVYNTYALCCINAKRNNHAALAGESNESAVNHNKAYRLLTTSFNHGRNITFRPKAVSRALYMAIAPPFIFRPLPGSCCLNHRSRNRDKLSIMRRIREISICIPSPPASLPPGLFGR